MSKWLTIVGMGEDGYESLTGSAKMSIAGARHVIGSSRLLALLPPLNAKTHEWPQPFSAVVHQIMPLRGTPTVVLATGDPMNYGAARKLLEILPFREMSVIPHVSAFSHAAARLGWSLPDCDCMTIHGRPAAQLEVYIQPEARVLVLTQDGSSIAECVKRLMLRGFGNSILTVLENMGGSAEAITRFVAHESPSRAWSDLNVLAIQCVASRDASVLSRVGGLPDDAFEHDGKITKREVRAATLAALQPSPDQLLWDVGAGSGSVSIEWMRSTRGCQAIAIETNPERCAAIARNAESLGTPRLKIVNADAPQAFASLAPPDAIFIGGAVDTPGIFETAFATLKAGGVCVANTVTLEGDRQLISLQEQYGGDLVRMDVSTLTMVGKLRALRPRMSVLQWRLRKGHA